ncbi:MAG TPA: hypothetical protein VHX88_10240 [Solirubrobacteraceae bacterium]|jgi:hypothetical protein|nr:hypothetical protein [Solirubrobacteraceae bacterium]
MSIDSLDELRERASHARRRLDLYKAKLYSGRPTSDSHLRELERESDSAATRLRAAELRDRQVSP